MEKISIILSVLLALSLVAVQVNGLELGVGMGLSTVAMNHLNELITAYNARMGMSLPPLERGLSLCGSATIGLTPTIDLGLEVEGLVAETSAVDPRGNPESITTSAVGLLGRGSWAVLRGGLQLHINAALGWYMANYSNDLEAITAQGSASGYKLGILLGLRLAESLSLDATLGWRGLAIAELVDPRGGTLSASGKPQLDFSGFELGVGANLYF